MQNLKKSKKMILALNKKNVKKVIDFLENQNNYVTVGYIYTEIGMEQSAVSTVLKELRDLKIVEETQRQGQFILYKLDKLKLSKTVNLLNSL